MDLVLQFCDDHLLDNVWARLVPATAFPDTLRVIQASAANSSSPTLPFVAGSSKWSQLISYLPHPPLSLPEDLPLEVYSKAVSAWPRDYIPRQLASLTVITLIGSFLLYFVFAWLSYTFIFDHNMMRHPRFLKNQIRLEIITSAKAIPGITILTLPIFQAEIMGYSRLYENVDDYGWTYLVLSVPM
jgi:Delta7-sterol 5-desaturase